MTHTRDQLWFDLLVHYWNVLNILQRNERCCVGPTCISAIRSGGVRLCTTRQVKTLYKISPSLNIVAEESSISYICKHWSLSWLSLRKFSCDTDRHWIYHCVRPEFLLKTWGRGCCTSFLTKMSSCDGRMVSASDSQPHYRGFESCVSHLAHQKPSHMGYEWWQ